MLRSLLVVFAVGSCGPEATSFRATDRGDGGEHDPPAAAYELAHTTVHVWSRGGYIGTSDEPMAHVGFDIANRGSRPVVFENDELQLAVFDARGAVRSGVFVAVTPLGPARVAIPPGATTTLEAYFMLPMRPLAVATMNARWALTIDGKPSVQITHFVRTDDYPVLEDPSAPRTSNELF